MENLEIKDIIDVNNIKKLKTEFYNLINSIEESKKNTIANFVFSAPSILIQFFLFGPLLITFLENGKVLKIDTVLKRYNPVRNLKLFYHPQANLSPRV